MKILSNLNFQDFTKVNKNFCCSDDKHLMPYLHILLLDKNSKEYFFKKYFFILIEKHKNYPKLLWNLVMPQNHRSM